ncbi:hypothetical protein ACQ9Y2_01550 [Pseudomonas palleroniana]
MLLVKSCLKRNNIKNGTLKLGTLNEYRHTEIIQIADNEEGLITHQLIFDGEVKVPLDWFNIFTGGAIQLGPRIPARLPGRTRTRINEIEVVSHNNEFAIIKNSSIDVAREALNSFIYCMSNVDKIEDCFEIFPDYDDYWAVNSCNAQSFGMAIGKTLLNKIKEEHQAGNFILPENTDTGKLLITMRWDEVKYTERKIYFNRDNEFAIEQLILQLRHMAFIKPPIPFEKEKEFRFHYTIHVNGNIIPPLVNSIILDASTMQEYVI